MIAGNAVRTPARERGVRSCPLCHRRLEAEDELAIVPVSPVAWPGVAGLEVHAGCLAAARRGAFEVPLPSDPVPSLAAVAFALLFALAVVLLRAVVPGPGWIVPAVAALVLSPLLAALALVAAVGTMERVDALRRRTA